MRLVPQFVIDYIKSIETLVSPARHLPVDAPGVITGGYGETDKSHVHKGMIVPESLATAWLTADLNAIGSSVEHIFDSCELSDGLYGALVDFAYNEGVNRLMSPDCSITPHVKAGDLEAAANSFLLYDVANGKHLGGLKTRRKVEIGWFIA